jgi:hypothetical protein
VCSIIGWSHFCEERGVDLVEGRVAINPRCEEAFKMLRWLLTSESH